MNDISDLDELIEILNSARVDYYKTYNKNIKAASVRLRRKLEDVAKRCREMRLEVLEYRKEVIDPRNYDSDDDKTYDGYNKL